MSHQRAGHHRACMLFGSTPQTEPNHELVMGFMSLDVDAMIGPDGGRSLVE